MVSVKSDHCIGDSVWKKEEVWIDCDDNWKAGEYWMLVNLLSFSKGECCTELTYSYSQARPYCIPLPTSWDKQILINHCWNTWQDWHHWHHVYNETNEWHTLHFNCHSACRGNLHLWGLTQLGNVMFMVLCFLFMTWKRFAIKDLRVAIPQTVLRTKKGVNSMKAGNTYFN